MSDTTATNGLPTWADQMKALEGVVDHLLTTWRPDGATPAEVQDMNKLVLSILSDGYLCRVYTDASRPIFMPLWNYAMNQGGPDPDYVYSTTEVDPAGTYRISGYRGTSRFVEITQQGFDMMNMGQLENGSPVPHTHDLDDLELDGEGYFSVVLSPERPAGHSGDWWPLDPRTKRLLMRKCSCDWAHEVDARVAIERLDDPGADMTPEEIARRFSDMAEWIKGMIGFDMGLVRYYREHHGVNSFMRSTKIDSIGGLPTQAYYDGIYEIEDDEALICETELPEDQPLLAGAGGRRPLLHGRLGEPPVQPQRRPGPRRQRRSVPVRGVEGRPRGAQLARQGRLPVGDHPDAVQPGERLPGPDHQEGEARRGARSPAERHAGGHARRAGRAAAPPPRGCPTPPDLVT